MLRCCAFGVSFQVETSALDLLPAIAGQLPFGTEAVASLPPGTPSFRVERSNAGEHVLLHGAEPVFTSIHVEEVLARLRQDLMVHVGDLAPEFVFLHAGVVSIGGRGLLLPGTSFAGKTTLVAELTRAGAFYYSDEYALMDAEGMVLPYSRELQMRKPGRPEQCAVPVSALSGHAGTGPLRISHVLFAHYRPGAVWAPAPVSSGAAVLEMLRHSIPVQRTPARVLACLSRLMETAKAWRSERDDCALVVPQLLSAVRGGLDLA